MHCSLRLLRHQIMIKTLKYLDIQCVAQQRPRPLYMMKSINTRTKPRIIAFEKRDTLSLVRTMPTYFYNPVKNNTSQALDYKSLISSILNSSSPSIFFFKHQANKQSNSLLLIATQSNQAEYSYLHNSLQHCVCVYFANINNGFHRFMLWELPNLAPLSNSS